MIISRSKGFMFLRGFKVGGTSVEAALLSVCGPDDIVDPQEPHLSPREARVLYPDDWVALRTLAIVRNPWDFSVAAAHHRYRLENPGQYKPEQAQDWMRQNFVRCMEEKLACTASSAEFTRRESMTPTERHAYWVFGASFATGDWFWLDEHGKPIEFDTVLRFESLEQDFLTLGLGPTLPKLNHFGYQSDPQSYRQYHTTRTRQIVEELHPYEILQFGYEF